MAVGGRRWPIPFRFRQHIIAPTGGGGGTVTYDTFSTATAATTAFTTSPKTWTHVNSGNCIVVQFVTAAGSSNPVTAVTYGGVSLPLIKFQLHSAGTSGTAFYGLIGGTVPTGSNTVSVTFTTGSGDMIAGAVSLANALSFGTAFGFTSTTTSVSGSVTGTTTGGMIVAGSSYGGGNGGGTFSGTNGVSIKWQNSVSNASAGDNAVQGTVASTGGGASQTVGFSNSQTADNWALVAVEVLPAAGAPAVGPANPLISSRAVSQASLW